MAKAPGIIQPDIIQNGVYKGCHIARRMVNPSAGDAKLRCGNCGAMEFEIHVKPTLDMARISACVCRGCGLIRNFDNNGLIESHRVPGADGLNEARSFLDKEVIDG